MFRVRGNKLDVQHGDDCGHACTQQVFLTLPTLKEQCSGSLKGLYIGTDEL